MCAACHGPNGNSTSGVFPILAGQTSRYLYLQLRDYKEGRRKDPDMTPITASLSQEDMLDLAEFFSQQKPAPLAFKPDPARVAAGAKIAASVACSMCHMGEMKGQNAVPRVAGQHPDYVIKQLKDLKNKTRTNDAGNMASVTATLSDEDIENLANYTASLF
jgi:cytochrome c553